MATVAGGQIEREARRLLPRLAAEGSYLAPLPGRQGSSDCSDYALFSAAHARLRSVLATSAAVVEGLCALGWIAREGRICRLTELGRAWIRRQCEGGDAFRRQHQSQRRTTRIVNGVPRPVLVNDAESPLAWLRRRKDKHGLSLISEAQYQAGERLRADFTRAQLMPRLTAAWGRAAPSRRARRVPADHGQVLSDDVLAAKQRVRQALAAVGPELADILIDVCCHLRGLSVAERERGWPQRSGKVILQLALTALARHYGLVAQPKPTAPVRGRVRHWGTDDFKPSLDAWLS